MCVCLLFIDRLNSGSDDERRVRTLKTRYQLAAGFVYSIKTLLYNILIYSLSLCHNNHKMIRGCSIKTLRILVRLTKTYWSLKSKLNCTYIPKCIIIFYKLKCSVELTYFFEFKFLFPQCQVIETISSFKHNYTLNIAIHLKSFEKNINFYINVFSLNDHNIMLSQYYIS